MTKQCFCYQKEFRDSIFKTPVIQLCIYKPYLGYPTTIPTSFISLTLHFKTIVSGIWVSQSIYSRHLEKIISEFIFYFKANSVSSIHEEKRQQNNL